jgi:D-glycero-D-manno-heptose 1,7-bisphosphate phosphatase
MKKNKEIKAAFFDRDGTLIEDVGYLSDINQISIIPQAIKFCLEYQTLGYDLFIVTNQSGIARGYFSEGDLQIINDHVVKLFEAERVFFRACYYCPHHPTEAVIECYKKKCNCRKPKPGMLLKAAEEYNIDLSKSLMFGDKQRDIDAGAAVGCGGRLVCMQDLI